MDPKVNNAACYYQMPFNVSLVLQQVSNHDNVPREQENTGKAAYRIQNNVISKENIVRPNIGAATKECMPNVSNDKNVND